VLIFLQKVHVILLGRMLNWEQRWVNL